MADRDEKPLVLVATKVTPETAEALRDHARGLGTTVSAVIRDLIDQRLQEYEL
jgi:predicted DNA-binding protein